MIKKISIFPKSSTLMAILNMGKRSIFLLNWVKVYQKKNTMGILNKLQYNLLKACENIIVNSEFFRNLIVKHT